MHKKRVVCFGEVLWDNLITGPRVGGAPLNVCYHLSKLGIDSRIISMVGADESGDRLLRTIENLGLSTAFCCVSDRYPTSHVHVKLLPDHEVGYDIMENVAWDYIGLTDRQVGLVEDADAFVFGSLAARSPLSRKTLLALVQRSRFNVLDVNLRERFYSKDAVLELIGWSDVLKINEDEVRAISKWLDVPMGIGRVAYAIFERFPRLQEIILTQGAKGAVYYDREGEVEVPARDIAVKDTVGSGDAFLAGFLAERLNGKPVLGALETAVLLSAFVAQHEGACPMYALDDIYK